MAGMSGGKDDEDASQPNEASQVPREGSKGRAVALLFLTTGPDKNADVWERWLRSAGKDEYSVYVHAKNPDLCQDPFMKKGLIEAVQTKWGCVSLVKAHVALLKAAFKDPQNEWFLLISDSCLPVKSFKSVRETLLDKKASIFDQAPNPVQKAQRENIRSFCEDLIKDQDLRPEEELIRELVQDKEALQAHSQWCCLIRKDVETLLQGDDLPTWYGAYRQMLPIKWVKRSFFLAPDELFIHTYLRYHARKNGQDFEFNTRQTTFAHCCLDRDTCECSLARASHPIVLNSLHPTVVIRSLERGSFFARKFAAGQNVSHWDLIWQYENDPAKMMEIAKLSLQLANPQRLTARQQVSVAMQLSVQYHNENNRSGHNSNSDNDSTDGSANGKTVPAQKKVRGKSSEGKRKKNVQNGDVEGKELAAIVEAGGSAADDEASETQGGGKDVVAQGDSCEDSGTHVVAAQAHEGNNGMQLLPRWLGAQRYCEESEIGVATVHSIKDEHDSKLGHEESAHGRPSKQPKRKPESKEAAADKQPADMGRLTARQQIKIVMEMSDADGHGSTSSDTHRRQKKEDKEESVHNKKSSKEARWDSPSFVPLTEVPPERLTARQQMKILTELSGEGDSRFSWSREAGRKKGREGGQEDHKITLDKHVAGEGGNGRDRPQKSAEEKESERERWSSGEEKNKTSDESFDAVKANSNASIVEKEDLSKESCSMSEEPQGGGQMIEHAQEIVVNANKMEDISEDAVHHAKNARDEGVEERAKEDKVMDWASAHSDSCEGGRDEEEHAAGSNVCAQRDGSESGPGVEQSSMALTDDLAAEPNQGISQEVAVVEGFGRLTARQQMKILMELSSAEGQSSRSKEVKDKLMTQSREEAVHSSGSGQEAAAATKEGNDGDQGHESKSKLGGQETQAQNGVDEDERRGRGKAKKGGDVSEKGKRVPKQGVGDVDQESKTRKGDDEREKVGGSLKKPADTRGKRRNEAEGDNDDEEQDAEDETKETDGKNVKSKKKDAESKATEAEPKAAKSKKYAAVDLVRPMYLPLTEMPPERLTARQQMKFLTELTGKKGQKGMDVGTEGEEGKQKKHSDTEGDRIKKKGRDMELAKRWKESEREGEGEEAKQKMTAVDGRKEDGRRKAKEDEGESKKVDERNDGDQKKKKGSSKATDAEKTKVVSGESKRANTQGASRSESSDSGSEYSGDEGWTADEVGRVVEIVCEDDEEETGTEGRVPALILKHVRKEIFIVRFKDSQEMRVNFDEYKVWRASQEVEDSTRLALGMAPYSGPRKTQPPPKAVSKKAVPSSKEEHGSGKVKDSVSKKVEGQRVKGGMSVEEVPNKKNEEEKKKRKAKQEGEEQEEAKKKKQEKKKHTDEDEDKEDEEGPKKKKEQKKKHKDVDEDKKDEEEPKKKKKQKKNKYKDEDEDEDEKDEDDAGKKEKKNEKDDGEENDTEKKKGRKKGTSHGEGSTVETAEDSAMHGMSREERKMMAIAKMIEKMEREEREKVKRQEEENRSASERNKTGPTSTSTDQTESAGREAAKSMMANQDSDGSSSDEDFEVPSRSSAKRKGTQGKTSDSSESSSSDSEDQDAPPRASAKKHSKAKSQERKKKPVSDSSSSSSSSSSDDDDDDDGDDEGTFSSARGKKKGAVRKQNKRVASDASSSDDDKKGGPARGRVKKAPLKKQQKQVKKEVATSSSDEDEDAPLSVFQKKSVSDHSPAKTEEAQKLPLNKPSQAEASSSAQALVGGDSSLKRRREAEGGVSATGQEDAGAAALQKVATVEGKTGHDVRREGASKKVKVSDSDVASTPAKQGSKASDGSVAAQSKDEAALRKRPAPESTVQCEIAALLGKNKPRDSGDDSNMAKKIRYNPAVFRSADSPSAPLSMENNSTQRNSLFAMQRTTEELAKASTRPTEGSNTQAGSLQKKWISDSIVSHRDKTVDPLSGNRSLDTSSALPSKSLQREGDITFSGSHSTDTPVTAHKDKEKAAENSSSSVAAPRSGGDLSSLSSLKIQKVSRVRTPKARAIDVSSPSSVGNSSASKWDQGSSGTRWDQGASLSSLAIPKARSPSNAQQVPINSFRPVAASRALDASQLNLAGQHHLGMGYAHQDGYVQHEYAQQYLTHKLPSASDGYAHHDYSQPYSQHSIYGQHHVPLPYAHPDPHGYVPHTSLYEQAGAYGQHAPVVQRGAFTELVGVPPVRGVYNEAAMQHQHRNWDTPPTAQRSGDGEPAAGSSSRMIGTAQRRGSISESSDALGSLAVANGDDAHTHKASTQQSSILMQQSSSAANRAASGSPGPAKFETTPAPAHASGTGKAEAPQVPVARIDGPTLSSLKNKERTPGPSLHNGGCLNGADVSQRLSPTLQIGKDSKGPGGAKEARASPTLQTSQAEEPPKEQPKKHKKNLPPNLPPKKQCSVPAADAAKVYLPPKKVFSFLQQDGKEVDRGDEPKK